MKFFRRFSPDIRKILLHFSELVEVNSHTILFDINHKEDLMYIILQGAVTVKKLKFFEKTNSV